MTFPHDHLREVKRVEEHSLLAVTGVSLAMVAVALLGFAFFMG